MLDWQRQGTGPDVVLVHGYLGSGQIFEPLIVHLAEHFSVTTIDLPGHAGSYDIPVPPTVEELAQMVASTIRSTGIERCSVLGHSLGAWIALELFLENSAMSPAVKYTFIGSRLSMNVFIPRLEISSSNGCLERCSRRIRWETTSVTRRSLARGLVNSAWPTTGKAVMTTVMATASVEQRIESDGQM